MLGVVRALPCQAWRRSMATRERREQVGAGVFGCQRKSARPVLSVWLPRAAQQTRTHKSPALVQSFLPFWAITRQHPRCICREQRDALVKSAQAPCLGLFLFFFGHDALSEFSSRCPIFLVFSQCLVRHRSRYTVGREGRPSTNARSRAHRTFLVCCDFPFFPQQFCFPD